LFAEWSLGVGRKWGSMGVKRSGDGEKKKSLNKPEKDGHRDFLRMLATQSQSPEESLYAKVGIRPSGGITTTSGVEIKKWVRLKGGYFGGGNGAGGSGGGGTARH